MKYELTYMIGNRGFETNSRRKPFAIKKTFYEKYNEANAAGKIIGRKFEEDYLKNKITQKELIESLNSISIRNKKTGQIRKYNKYSGEFNI